MRKLIFRTLLTLDGIAAGVDGAQIEGIDYGEEDAWRDIFDTLQRVDAMLLGATAHRDYLTHWAKVLTDPNAAPNDRRFAEIAARTPHFVLSRSMTSVDWPNATVLAGGVDGIAGLKASAGGDILLWGGPTVAAAAIDAGLVDEYHLEIHPVIAGRGTSLFAKVSGMHRLRHMRTDVFPTGVSISKYRSA